MSYVTRSRVLKNGVVVAILPTWSDGALVKAERPDIEVQDGEWLGEAADAAPSPTHKSAASFLDEAAQ